MPNQTTPLPTPQPVKYDMPGGLSPSPGYSDILGMLTRPRQSYTEMTFPSVLPLLQPQEGMAPEIAQAIEMARSIGGEMTGQDVASTQTEMMKRGLTGSSIEAGGLGEARALGGQRTMATVMPMLMQQAQQKQQGREKLAGFLSQAYGIDLKGQDEILDRIAMAMGEEQARSQDAAMFGQYMKYLEEGGKEDFWSWKGAGAGAMTGAGVGTAISPGWGTAIGGVGGGLLGGLTGGD